MKNHYKSFSYTLLGGLLLTATTAHAEEPHPGKILHDQANCMKCHEAKPYNPEKTSSYPKLVETVQFCSNNLNLGFWEEEVEQVADYLNGKYYHHPKE